MFASRVLHLPVLLALANDGTSAPIQVDPGVSAIRTCRLSCVSFRTESEGWLFDRCGNVYRTSNGGDGWTHDLAAEAFFNKEPAPPKPAKKSENDPLYKAFASGAGMSLETLTRMATRGHVEFMHWFSPTEAVAGGDIGASVLRTTDAGKTWTRVATPTSQWVYVVEARGDTLWTCGSSGEIIRSTDRGRTWLSRRSPFNASDRCVALSFGANRHGQALGMLGSQWTTTDDGATWTADTTSPPVDAPVTTKAPDAGTRSSTIVDRVHVQPMPAGLPAHVGRVHLQPVHAPVRRGGGSVRIDGSLLVFDEPGGALRSGPARSVASGKRVPLLAVERIDRATYGWTSDQLFFAEDGLTWYAVGPLPTVPRRITFVNKLAVVLEGKGGTFRSEDRGAHWKPSSQAALDVADADRTRVGGERAKKGPLPSPFACLDRASEGVLNVEFDVEGCFGGSHSGLSLRISKGVATLSGTIDHPASSSSQIDRVALLPAERARLLQGVAAAATRLEEPSDCRDTTTHKAEVSWRCESPTPKGEGRLAFTTNACDEAGLAEGVGASTSFGGRPGGYARALGIVAWAREALNRHGAR
jgi:photosystem II stability/assembly factor-like uncharacterized protein